MTERNSLGFIGSDEEDDSRPSEDDTPCPEPTGHHKHQVDDAPGPCVCAVCADCVRRVYHHEHQEEEEDDHERTSTEDGDPAIAVDENAAGPSNRPTSSRGKRKAPPSMDYSAVTLGEAMEEPISALKRAYMGGLREKWDKLSREELKKPDPWNSMPVEEFKRIERLIEHL